MMTNTSISAQNTISLAERLGYSPETKLLIIHADDIALSHSENQASFEAMDKGSINSGSIMVPCPWFLEVADHVKTNPDLDLGVHLTFTAEWKHYKWGPVLGKEKVPSLVNEAGYFYDNVSDMAKNAKAEEVEQEIKAQIEQVIAVGIKPTHLDSHMGALFRTPELFSLYLKAGENMVYL